MFPRISSYHQSTAKLCITHPIFAIFIGDYPEQALVTCTFSGRCPKCLVTPGQLGESQCFPSCIQCSVIDTYLLADGDIPTFHLACRKAGLKPVYHPFWETLPLADIFLSITPDILHQMLQGMMKHLISWLVSIFGPMVIDTRCKVIPPNHKILLFTKGITMLSQVSDHEHKKMCSIFLGLIVDLPVPGGVDSSHMVKATCALLDFLFLAQFQSHTCDTIHRLEECLATFHNNKAIFVDLGIREHFNIPKLHSLLHYASSIHMFGTTDNYNTEQTERLHIDLAKDAYCATNHKGEFAQMTMWLECCEKVQQHLATIDQRLNDQRNIWSRTLIGPLCAPPQLIKMA
jgi:Plavaka transposase